MSLILFNFEGQYLFIKRKLCTVFDFECFGSYDFQYWLAWNEQCTNHLLYQLLLFPSLLAACLFSLYFIKRMELFHLREYLHFRWWLSRPGNFEQLLNLFNSILQSNLPCYNSNNPFLCVNLFHFDFEEAHWNLYSQHPF